MALVERLPQAGVSNSYGMTEAGPAFIVMPQEEVTKRIGSVGKPIPPMEIKIVDDDDNEGGPHEVGELLTRLPGRQREYYKDTDATASTWTLTGGCAAETSATSTMTGSCTSSGARRTSSSGADTTCTRRTSRA